VSGCVALRLPSAGAVVTYFVTGSRTSALQMDDDRWSWRIRIRHHHSATTGESGVVTRICERTLPPPVKVCPPRWSPLPPTSPPSLQAGSARRGCGAWLAGVDGHRQTCVGGQFHRRSSGRGRRRRVMEMLDPSVVEAEVMRAPLGRGTPSCVSTSPPISPDRSRLCPGRLRMAGWQTPRLSTARPHSTGAARPRRLADTLFLSAIWGAVCSGVADPCRPTLLVFDECQDFLDLRVNRKHCWCAGTRWPGHGVGVSASG